MKDRRQALLVTPQWLHAHRHDADLRILDCTIHMLPQPVGASKIISGQVDYQQAHIPGAQHVDMVTDLSAAQAPYPYTLPSAAEIERLLSRLGLGNQHRVVLYGRGHIPTITRCWYVLHVMGHRHVAILDGGFERWQREGYPLSSEQVRFLPTHFVAHPLPNKVAGFDEVRAAVNSDQVVLVNALGREQFAGTGGAHYGRPGRIPGSVNAPARELADQQTKLFASTQTMRALFEASGSFRAPRVITYCGGGIAASATAFALELLGHPNWALYDNSLLEWATRDDTEMETG